MSACCCGDDCIWVFMMFCKRGSSAEMLQQVWQTLALIIYFCAWRLVEEGFSHPSQLHKTHAQSKQCSCPLAEDEGVSVVAACNSPAERLARLPGAAVFFPVLEQSSCACLPPPPPPQLLTAAPALAATGQEQMLGNRNSGPEMPWVCSPGSMTKWGEPQLCNPKAWG